MRFVYFTHALASCWNHGNAHFQRGVLRELAALGHEVVACEPEDGWSRANLLAGHGPEALEAWRRHYPELGSLTYPDRPDWSALTDGADVVIVHEWNDPAMVAAIGRLRQAGARFTLLFHDTHHRAVSDADALRRYDLSAYDGVLAFGAALADVYRAWGWGDRAFVWHEAADTRHFVPPAEPGERAGIVWIGNWGDGERAAELTEYLLAPAAAHDLPLDVYGVRYPDEALAALERYGARYRGWLANADVPSVFARHLFTVHVPRGYYARALPGIPTIRVFEALACGIPLVSAPWPDAEGLFRPGLDFLVARDGGAMRRHMRDLAADAGLRAELVRSGLARIRERHTCAHRARDLLAILAGLRQAPRPARRAEEVPA